MRGRIIRHLKMTRWTTRSAITRAVCLRDEPMPHAGEGLTRPETAMIAQRTPHACNKVDR